MCENTEGIIQETSLQKAPPVYVFYIKDYGINKGAALRYNEDFIETARGQQVKYILKAVISHEGPDRHSGHFRAYIKAENRIWYCVKLNITQADDETTKITSWDNVQKSSGYVLFYQKVGDIKAVEKLLADEKSLSKKEANIKNIVEVQTAKKAEEIQRENDRMVEFVFNEEGQIKAATSNKETVLKKRRPHRVIRDPLTKLTKMRVLAAKAPQLETSRTGIAEEGVTKVTVSDLMNRQHNPKTWTDKAEEAVTQLTSTNKFMLGKVERKRDEYDVEYDKGKLKKVKKQKVEKKFNFDKQAKRLKKEREDESTDNKKKVNRYLGKRPFKKEI